LKDVGSRLRRLGPWRAVAMLVRGCRAALADARGRRLLWVGALVNLALFGALVVALVMGAFAATASLAASEGWWLVMVAAAIRLASVVGAVLLAPILFQLLTGLVLLVFRERLFRFGRLAGGASPDDPEEGVSLSVVLATEVWRLVRLPVVSALLFLLNAVPVVGSVAYIVGQFLVASHALAWDLLSPHLEMRGLTYKEQKAALKEARGTVLAFGAAALGLGLIPGLQLLFLSTNVVGAGLVSAKLDEG